MRVDWYGQAAFRLSGQDATVFIDPFGDVSPMAARGIQFDYPAIEGVEADLLLVTHEHLDHNGVETIGGDPTILRSTAGRLESPVGEIVAIASEHDEAAGTQRGPNTIFVFKLDGLRIAHFGDFGQRALRDEQADAIGQIDLLFLPGRRRPDDRGRAGRGDHAPPRSQMGRADALSHAADRIPRNGRRVPREDAPRRAAVRDRLRHAHVRGRGRPARGGSRRALSRYQRSARVRAPRARLAAGPADSRGAPPSPGPRPARAPSASCRHAHRAARTRAP